MQIAVKSPTDIAEAQRTAALAAEAATEAAAARVESALEGLCWKEFDAARRAKESYNNEMLNLLRARSSQYTAEELALIEAEGGGSRVYIPLPQEKVAVAVSWLKELYGGDRPFDCEPSPIPDVPPEVMQILEQEAAWRVQNQMGMVAESPEQQREFIESEKARVLMEARQWAQRRAKRNTEKVNDVLVEGGFYLALEEAYDDACALLGGFIHGPIVKMQRELVWSKDGRGAKIEKVPKRVFESPSAFDVYPAPGSAHVQHSHISLRLRLQPNDLAAMKGVKGFKDDRIAAAIEKYGTDGLQNWFYEDVERADLEGRSTDQLLTQKGLYDVILHYTFATGKMLIDWGMTDEGLDPGEVYSISAWMLGRHELIGARINDDPSGKRPLIKIGFRQKRGAFWNDGAIKIILELVKMANAAARALANNMAMSAGFFTEVQIDRLAANEPVRSPLPYSVVQTVAPLNGAAGPAMYVHQAQVNAQAYIGIHGWLSQLCDTVLGLPSFMSGASTGGGAGDTSSGLAQLREMATRTFKGTVADIDRQLADAIDCVHTDLVLTDGAEDPDLIGDVSIVVKGTKAFSDRQAQQVRLNELVVGTNNPTDTQIMGPEGRAELLRAAIAGFDGIDIDRTIPSREEIIFKMKTAAAQAVGMDVNGNPLPGAAQPPQGAATLPDGSVAGGADQQGMQ